MWKILILVIFVANFWPSVNASAGSLAKHCIQNSDEFQTNNRAQLDGVAESPLFDLWYQNVTVFVINSRTGIQEPAISYGFWQRHTYNEENCAFIDVRGWYRLNEQEDEPLQMVFEEIHTIISTQVRADDFFPSQSYRLVWKTNKTADSALIDNALVASRAVGSNVLRTDYIKPRTGILFFTEQIQTIEPFERRYYSQVITVDPSGHILPLHVWMDSRVIPSVEQPQFVIDAFAAYDLGKTTIEQDSYDPRRYVETYSGIPEEPDNFLPQRTAEHNSLWSYLS